MRRRSGFTLIELMIVLAIIAALAAILTPMGLNALNRAQATQLIADVRNVRAAAQVYYFDKKEVPEDIDAAVFETYLDVDELTNRAAFTYERDASNSGAFTLTLVDAKVSQGVKDQIPNVWTQDGYSTTSDAFSFDFTN